MSSFLRRPSNLVSIYWCGEALTDKDFLMVFYGIFEGFPTQSTSFVGNPPIKDQSFNLTSLIQLVLWQPLAVDFWELELAVDCMMRLTECLFKIIIFITFLVPKKPYKLGIKYNIYF